MKHFAGTPKEFIEHIPNGSTILFGGFGLCGIPENLIKMLADSSVTDLVCISNNAGTDDYGLGILLKLGKIKKMICCYVGNNKRFEQAVLNNEIEYEFIPSGSLVERCRAAASGIPAFYTKVGAGTIIQGDKEVRYFDGEKYLLEHALKADYAFVKAWKGDRFGNLIFKNTEENFNPSMAMAGKTTVVEVEEFLLNDCLDPNSIDLPGIFVQHVFQGETYENRMEEQQMDLRENQEDIQVNAY